MHQINDAIVRDGKIVLSNLPFADGQHVQIVVADADEQLAKTATIDSIRQTLRGGVERFDDPIEPMIPVDSWEMLK
ncbi:MAG TPA: hypothetical protein VFC78_01490 [Tepidisphaeraceae bacterium]|nr:hypothetical protein [Tepidisphaeraceae bacterium]